MWAVTSTWMKTVSEIERMEKNKTKKKNKRKPGKKEGPNTGFTAVLKAIFSSSHNLRLLMGYPDK